jgi:hypothetical protein
MFNPDTAVSSFMLHEYRYAANYIGYRRSQPISSAAA